MGSKPGPSLRRFGLFTLPVLGMGAPTLFSVSIGVLAPYLLDELSASRAELGLLATVTYAMAAVAAPLAGRFVDAVGVRRSMSLLFVVAASALALLGGASGYAVAVVAALLAGLGEASNTPFTNRVVQSAFPRGQHGIVIAAKQSGVKASHLIAAALLPTTAILWGWQASLLALAACAALGVPLAWFLLRTSDVRTGPAAVVKRAPVGPRVRLLALFGGLMAMGQGPVQTYLPLFGTEAVDMSLQASAMVLAVSSGVAIAARLAWGWLSERLFTLGVALIIIALGSCVSVALIAAAPSLGQGVLWAGAILFGGTAAVWSTLVYMEVLRTTPPASVGWASGLVHMAFLSGLGVSPVVFGWVVDVQGTYTLGWMGAIAAFAAASVVAGVVARRSPAEAVEPT